MPMARVNGVNLYYETAGEGAPLVLVHGSWGDHNSWAQVVPLLAESFRVLTFDRRGHSQSERPHGQGSVHEDVSDLGALIEETGFAPAHVVGQSFGGTIGLRLACERPQLFRSLVVHEPTVLGILADEAEWQPFLAQENSRQEAVVEQLRRGDMEGGARLFVETMALGPGAWEQLPPPVQQIMVHNAPTWLDEVRDPDVYEIDLEALSRFPKPALFTRGEQGRPFFAPLVAKLAAAIRGSEVVTIPGAAHAPHLSHPERYVEVVTAFLRVRGILS